MARITRPQPKPKTRYLHGVNVGHGGMWATRQDELWAAVTSIAGIMGYKREKPFWACTVIKFDTAEKAAAFRRWLRQVKFYADPLDLARPWVDPYIKVARAQHAVIWGLSTGIIRDVVRMYRHRRIEHSEGNSPANWHASTVILTFAPAIDRDTAREMVDAMLQWTVTHHRAWFARGLWDLKITGW